MCHQTYRKRKGIGINLEFVEKAIRESADMLASVNFGASSEPLLDKERLFACLDIANKYNVMDTFVHSNGILLDEKTILELLSRELKHLCISLDAATLETYKKMRNSDKYETVINNIKNFIKLRGDRPFPQLRVSFCVTSWNEHEAKLFHEKWKNVVDVINYQELGLVEGVDESVKTNSTYSSSICKKGRIRGMM